ncbi:MFS transporter [Streptomyces sp. NPDC020125]|uniref:MFS transporter n=1 Tax=Streptomyces sp. NPDC020125 TaxID=3154593 RepID=UPI0033DE03D2
MLVVALAATDYIDRQIIVSAFPHLKKEWGLSDAALGALVSTVSITMAVFALPVARLTDRWGRVRSIAAMGGLWSLAALWSATAGSYAQLFTARSMLGVGEAGYGPAGAALLSSYFPQRLRATVLSIFQAAGPLGSVLGVVLGGTVVEHWGWRLTLGAFGVPGLVLALMFLRVRDYRAPAAADDAVSAAADTSTGSAGTSTAAVDQPKLRETLRELCQVRTATWCYAGGALNLVLLSTLYTWLPTYLTREDGLSSAASGTKTALVILAGAAGTVAFGHLADRCGAHRPRRRLMVPALTAGATCLLLTTAFGVLPSGGAQFALVVAAGFPLAAALGTAPAAVVDVVRPRVRATALGMAVVAQNLLGLAVGPVLTGMLSDAFGLRTALALMPLFCAAAAVAFWRGSRTYEKDLGGWYAASQTAWTLTGSMSR